MKRKEDPIFRKKGDRKSPRYIIERIYRYELPSLYTIKHVNLMFLINARKKVKSSKGEVTVYHLHGRTHSEMKRYILNLPAEEESYIEKIKLHFPERADTDIYRQCAYYFRAYSRSQIFYDANHRTGYFSLSAILRKKGIVINASLDEVIGLTEYIKAQGWLKQGRMMVTLKEKDKEYDALRWWFGDKLELR